MQAWLSDPVIKEWIEFEPRLRGTDLAPLFLFLAGPVGCDLWFCSKNEQAGARNVSQNF